MPNIVTKQLERAFADNVSLTENLTTLAKDFQIKVEVRNLVRVTLGNEYSKRKTQRGSKIAIQE